MCLGILSLVEADIINSPKCKYFNSCKCTLFCLHELGEVL